MSTNHVDQLAQQLLDAGVKYAFGITGSGMSLRLIESLDQLGVQYFPVHHEAAAAIMAGACCRDGITRAASITIKGPGFANLIPGILSNQYEGRPAISISEAYATDAPGWRKHKRLDHFALSNVITKGIAQVGGDAEEIKALFSLAQTEYPGPVHIDLCPSPGERIELLCEQLDSTESASELDKLLDRVIQSSCPAVILGSLALRRLREIDWSRLTIPIATTAAAKGSLDEMTPFSAGIITGEVSALSPETTILSKADLIIGIGLRNDEVVKAASFGPDLCIIDSVSGDHHVGFEAGQIVVSSDIECAVDNICQLLSEKNWGKTEIRAARKMLAAHLGSDWLPAQLFRKLQCLLPIDTSLVLDTGFFCTVGETVWAARRPEYFCGSSVGRFMGTAIPSAIGIAVSNPTQPVLCVVGDGGLPPYMAEIEMAVLERLPILFVYVTDGRYGSVAAFTADSQVVSRAVDVGCKIAWNIANAMECPAFLITDSDELEAVLAGWSPNSGPLFLQCQFEPVAYASQAKPLR